MISQLEFKSNVLDRLNNLLAQLRDTSQVYLAIAAHFRRLGYEGLANWMKVQSEHAVETATRVIEYAGRRGSVMTLDTVAKPDDTIGKLERSFTLDGLFDRRTETGGFKVDSLSEIFSLNLDLEQRITETIYGVYGEAAKYEDFATPGYLQWLVDDQIEKEYVIRRIQQQFNTGDRSPMTLAMLDKEVKDYKFKQEPNDYLVGEGQCLYRPCH